MPVLKNAKHERFAQGIADGIPQIDAYVAAGFQRSESSASRLAKSSQVKARVSELLDQKRAETDQVKRTALAVAQYDATRIVVELAGTIQQSEEIFRRCMQGAPVLDDKGKPVMVQVGEGEIAAAYVFDASGANKAIANKIKGLHLLGIDAGRFVHRHQVSRSPIDALPPDLVRALEQSLAIVLEQKPGLQRREPVTIEGEAPGPISGDEPAGGSPAGAAGGGEEADRGDPAVGLPPVREAT